MAIKVTSTGKVITKGGLPSCACCGDECDEQTTICIAFNDYVIGPQNITLTGSLNAGSFTGIYDPCGSAYTIELIWDGAAWGFWYNGIHLINDPPTSTATISGETIRCNPVGATINYEDAMIIVEAEVLSFEPCLCACDPDITTATLYADYVGAGETVSLSGSLCAGYFEGTGDYNFILEWNGCAWDLIIASLGPQCPAAASTDRCDPTGTYDDCLPYWAFNVAIP